MQVINNKTHYLTNISYEYLDGTKKTYDYDEITARGQTNALAEISSAISLFKLKECSISAKTDAIDITIYGIINKEFLINCNQVKCSKASILLHFSCRKHYPY